MRLPEQERLAPACCHERRAAKKRFDAEEDFKIRAREAVTLLQSGGEGQRNCFLCVVAAATRWPCSSWVGRHGTFLEWSV